MAGYARVFRRYWWMVLGGVVVGLLVGVVIIATVPARYSSQTSIYFFTQSASGDAAAAYDASLLARDKAGSYLPVLSGPQLSADVAARLTLAGVPTTPRSVEGSVTAVTEGPSQIVLITATDTSAQRAQLKASLASDALLGFVGQVEQPDPAQPPTVAARVILPASTPTGADAPGPALILILGAVIGLVVGALAALTVSAISSSRPAESPGADAATEPATWSTDLDDGRHDHDGEPGDPEHAGLPRADEQSELDTESRPVSRVGESQEH